MYINSHFRVHPATSLAFAAARGFGLVIAADDGRPVASHLPFRLIEADGEVPKLEFHVARANPLGAFAEKGGTCTSPAPCGSFGATTREATPNG